MEMLKVTGGAKLSGQVRVPGAKNSVLPIMAASLLCTGSVTLLEVPALSDVAMSCRILESLGCTIYTHKGRIEIHPGAALGSEIPKELMQSMRSSLFYLAPILSKTKRAVISTPGGCNLGARPIDLHLRGLEAMGATITMQGTEIELTVPNGLHGAEISLRFPSVGATETLLMAAACAKGETVICGAAVEPEVTDLVHFLQTAGASISGAGTRVLHITGKPVLGSVQHAICPDRITAATILCAVAGCGGETVLTHTSNEPLEAIIQPLRNAGCTISSYGTDSLLIASDGNLKGIGALDADVFPAFPTDAAPILGAALLKAKGNTTITDRVFENRFVCAEAFRAFGANAAVSQRMLLLYGMPHLNAAHVMAADLRGGAALVIAALQAQGESEITGVQHIARGYENIADLFCKLGAQVALVKG